MRKEPQFDDDVNASALQSSAVAPQPEGLINGSGEPRRSSVPWILWFLVVICLALSFGMAWFGLDEAGRYQAALNRASAQALELEATIERINEAQAEGIGALAQSDAQMRQALASMEARLAGELTDKLASIQAQQTEKNEAMDGSIADLEKRMEAAAAEREAQQRRLDPLASIPESISKVQTSIDNLETAIATIEQETQANEVSVNALTSRLSQVSEALQTETNRINQLSSIEGNVKILSEELTTKIRQLENQTVSLTADLEQGRARSDQLAALPARIDRLSEEVALVSQQISSERVRLDAIAELPTQFSAVVEEQRAQQLSMVELSDQLIELQRLQGDEGQSLDAIAGRVRAVEDELVKMESDPGQALAVEVLAEQVDQLSAAVSESTKLLQAVDASRKQLAQRLIDLEERLNQSLQAQE